MVKFVIIVGLCLSTLLFVTGCKEAAAKTEALRIMKEFANKLKKVGYRIQSPRSPDLPLKTDDLEDASSLRFLFIVRLGRYVQTPSVSGELHSAGYLSNIKTVSEPLLKLLNSGNGGVQDCIALHLLDSGEYTGKESDLIRSGIWDTPSIEEFARLLLLGRICETEANGVPRSVSLTQILQKATVETQPWRLINGFEFLLASESSDPIMRELQEDALVGTRSLLQLYDGRLSTNRLALRSSKSLDLKLTFDYADSLIVYSLSRLHDQVGSLEIDSLLLQVTLASRLLASLDVQNGDTSKAIREQAQRLEDLSYELANTTDSHALSTFDQKRLSKYDQVSFTVNSFRSECDTISTRRSVVAASLATIQQALQQMEAELIKKPVSQN